VRSAKAAASVPEQRLASSALAGPGAPATGAQQQAFRTWADSSQPHP
jgi:hypothetical protein